MHENSYVSGSDADTNRPDVRDAVELGVGEDPLGQAAGLKDCAASILTGIAANKSMAEGRPVNIDDLFELE